MTTVRDLGKHFDELESQTQEYVERWFLWL